MEKKVRRTAIVTGASKGIGEAILKTFVKEGHYVVANARNEKELKSLSNSLNKEVGDERVVVCTGDVSDHSTAIQLLTICKARFGINPNLLIVNAGRGMPGTILNSDTEEWMDLVKINLIGVFWQLRILGEAIADSASECTLKNIPHDIVVLGSSVGRWVSPFNSVYGSTKSAVHSITEGMRQELASKNVRVSLIEPGIVKSDFQRSANYDMEWFRAYCDEIGPVLEPKDIAEIVNFIVSRPAHVHINDVMIRPTRQVYP